MPPAIVVQPTISLCLLIALAVITASPGGRPGNRPML